MENADVRLKIINSNWRMEGWFFVDKVVDKMIEKIKKLGRRGYVMESVDMNKLETAITYLQRIADGNDPINNLPADEDSVLNNPNMIRCMFFVKDVLEEVKRNGGYIGKKASSKDKEEFPIENVAKFEYREDKAISRLVEQLNEGLDENRYKKLNYRTITQWLKLNGFLQEEESSEFNKKITIPTEKGELLGIRATRRSSARGVDYMLVTYDKHAQEYIVHNLDKILCGEVVE